MNRAMLWLQLAVIGLSCATIVMGVTNLSHRQKCPAPEQPTHDAPAERATQPGSVQFSGGSCSGPCATTGGGTATFTAGGCPPSCGAGRTYLSLYGKGRVTYTPTGRPREWIVEGRDAAIDWQENCVNCPHPMRLEPSK